MATRSRSISPPFHLVTLKNLALIVSIFAALSSKLAAHPANDGSALKESAQTRGADLVECKRPVFTGISEIIMVVEDVDASVKKQWDLFGIGPWHIWTFDASTVDDMMVHGKRQDFSIRIAYTKIGDTYWELVEPLDKKSTYYETLQQHGESVHNIVFDVDDFDETASFMKRHDISIYNAGNWSGTEFINFDTRGRLPVIAEIFRIPEGGEFPAPESTYPPMMPSRVETPEVENE